jgi:hypothetical protein
MRRSLVDAAAITVTVAGTAGAMSHHSNTPK